jgi:lipopolysaccharide export system protein LptC
MSEVAVQMQSQRRTWAAPAGHHDRVVRIALVALPIAIGVLAAFLVMAPAFMGGDVSFLLDPHKVEVARERLRIQAAEYRGRDQKGQPFTLHAGSAVQQSSREPIVHLRDLTASIQLPDGPAQIRADRGRYDMDTEQVSVDGPIKVTSADGSVMDTENAVVDLKTRKLASGGRVTGTTPLGTFGGDKLSADLATRIVRLDGNAHLRVVPHRAKRRP